jgi:hypothetical protein
VRLTSDRARRNDEGVLYEYRLDWSKGSERHHIDGEKQFIERYVPKGEFEKLFGGYALLRDATGRREFLGVWGRQEIARFKRTLRDRGALFVVISEESGNRFLKQYAQFHRPR